MSEPRLHITAWHLFTSWLAAQNASLAFTTHQAGNLFFIGLDAQSKARDVQQHVRAGEYAVRKVEVLRGGPRPALRNH